MWTDRTKILIGEENLEKLQNSHVAVIGIGGVGGYVCMMLVRAGVGNLTLVDFDMVAESNINRQIVANVNTIGEHKTMIMERMIREINPNCCVKTFEDRFCKDNMDEILSGDFDYVVDAIDCVTDKIELICYCKERNINIVSAMGAGNRKGIPSFKVTDIYKTSNDGLAKIIRKKLRERRVEGLDVVTSEEKAEKTGETTIGSISYYPAMCGCVLGAYVINKLID